MTFYLWTGNVNSQWSNAGNWTPAGGPPGSGDGVLLGSIGESVIVSGVDAAVDVFTEGFGPSNAPTLTVNSGRTFTINGAGSGVVDGTLNVQTGATMIWNFDGTFSNQGTIVIGQILSAAGGNGSLGIDGAVTLNEGGTLDLGQVSNAFQNESTGSITNSGMTFSDTLINVDNTIAGGGTISVSQFDNQAKGVVEATQSEGNALQISSVTFTNEGLMISESRAQLDFGTDGGSGSLTNTGSIELQNDGDLAISGNFTISGSGEISSTASGADITSDGAAAATFTNESSIDYGSIFSSGVSGQIGDVGVFGTTNDLTFVNNGGSVAVKGAGNALTLNTGSHTITNTDAGKFIAEAGGQLNIDSAVTTGGNEFFFMGHLVGGGGTIEAESGGKVTISSAITPGGSGFLFDNGQILIAGGTVVMAAGGTDTTPINFSGFGGALQLDSAANTVGTIGGIGVGGLIDLRYQAFAAGDHAVVSGSTLSLENGGGTTLASFTLSGSYSTANFTVLSDGSGGTEIKYINPPPPAGTSAAMIMTDTSGDYEIYDIGNNAILAAYSLGQVGTEWRPAGVGGFDGSDTDDMILRNTSTGAFELYDISSNNITGAVSLGQVGTDWAVSGFADFSSKPGETDMLMQNMGNGDFEVYDISNNAITQALSMGQVGTQWAVAGFGDFSGKAGETGDMLMQNTTNGDFEVYDIANNKITTALSMGQVGLEWKVAGFGDFSGNANETDMLMRDSINGAFEIYDISNNAIYNAASMGQVGLEWQVVGFGPIDGAGTSDMLMRDTSTGAFEVYDISNNKITTAASMGQVGTEWSVAGLAADPPSMPSQLAQAMASYAPSNGVLDTSAPPDQAIQSATTGLLATTNAPAHPIG